MNVNKILEGCNEIQSIGQQLLKLALRLQNGKDSIELCELVSKLADSNNKIAQAIIEDNNDTRSAS
jgi:hypothetical protein